ncbi:glutathione S-transferase-like [Ischnura elegans]|uniref:glutathione S-transferase-like n=1 Tax=Ischnura elegans TaxID=197161 RepID=UPI001ED873B9|nr:glutathione S-transferase-like [Ischnura elegans]
MEHDYKLTYFNGRGLAEPIRLLFAYARVDYKDVRIEKEQWMSVKPTTPFGKVPVLEVNGKKVGQSVAICRYLARKWNLVGNSDWDALQCDMLVDALGDLKQQVAQYRMEQDPIKKEEKKQELIKNTIPYYLQKFEHVLKENDGYLVNGQLTWADFQYAASLENFELIFGKEALDQYPHLKALKEKVFDLPGVKEWVAERPVTEF